MIREWVREKPGSPTVRINGVSHPRADFGARSCCASYINPQWNTRKTPRRARIADQPRNYRSPRPGNGVQDITLGDDSRVGGWTPDRLLARSSPASELGDGGHRCRGANAITRGYADKSSRANRSSSAALYQCHAA